MGDAAAFIYQAQRGPGSTQRQAPPPPSHSRTGEASAAARGKKSEEMAPTPHPPGRQRSGQLSATVPVAVVLPVQVLLLSPPLLQWPVRSRLLGLLLISRSKYSVGAIN
jgi:hypothetical protein